jgi:hypothetical protein
MKLLSQCPSSPFLLCPCPPSLSPVPFHLLIFELANRICGMLTTKGWLFIALGGFGVVYLITWIASRKHEGTAAPVPRHLSPVPRPP